MLQPRVLVPVPMQHPPGNVSASAADALVRDLLGALVADAVIGDVQAAAAAGQQVLRGAGGVARELAREQRAVVRQRCGVVAGPAAGLLRSVLQADASGAYKSACAGAAREYQDSGGTISYALEPFVHSDSCPGCMQAAMRADGGPSQAVFQDNHEAAVQI